MKDTATGVFETASRINHSFVPNSAYMWKDIVGRMVFWNRFKLFKGKEVTVDYEHKPNHLKRICGFECQCGGCMAPWSDILSALSLEDAENKKLDIDEVFKKHLSDIVGDEAKSGKWTLGSRRD